MEDKFLELKKKLDETLSYPTVYMFKFILEADNRKIALIENLFTEDAEIYTKLTYLRASHLQENCSQKSFGLN